MNMQDTASGVALWRQVADGIERGIADGRFATGEKLPGEMEIAETYRVNRHTVRRALATLAERGLVRAERGSGTYVEAQRLAYPLRSRTRFSEIVGAGGQEPRGQLIEASDDVATRELGARIGGFEDRRAADPGSNRFDPPTARRSASAPPGSPPNVSPTPDGSLANLLRSMTKLLAHYGVRDFSRASTRITAAIADATDAARLDLALGRPVLVVDSTDVDIEGRPIVTKRSRFAAERVEFFGGEYLRALFRPPRAFR